MPAITDDMVAVLAADHTSGWWLEALRSAIHRDSIEAANDAEQRAQLLTGRVEAPWFLDHWRPSGIMDPLPLWGLTDPRWA